jgi:hypothetical protein
MHSLRQLIAGSKFAVKLKEKNEMAIIAKAGGDFTPAPEGLWHGVCVDVVDKGIVESAIYKPRHMIQIRWVIEAEPKLPDGKPHMAIRSFGLSLHEQSKLRPFLETWRGKRFTEDELCGFDIENLIGANGQVQILHNTFKGKTYGNVQAVFPMARGAEKMPIPSDYIRQEERDRRAALEANPDGDPPYQDAEPQQISDEDIPF